MRHFALITKTLLLNNGGRVMTNTEASELLKNISPFSALDPSKIRRLVSEEEILSFRVGENITSERESGTVTVILSGAVSVTKQNGKKELLMRVVGKGGILGVTSAFAESRESLSHIRAIKDTEAIFVSRESMQGLVSENTRFAEEYIRLLTAKIQFLNGRIKAYTSHSAESRLALHLLSLDETQSGRVITGLSKTDLADMLDIGRASLYRALDSLTEKGVIKYGKNEFTVLDRASLIAAAENKL